MADRPAELGALLNAPDAPARDRAWQAFTQRYSPLMLSAIQAVGHDRDRVMDAYAFALEALHADGCRRLTKYSENGRGAFTTWLTVVVRRLAIDFDRQQVGRLRRDNPTAMAARAARQRLVGALGGDTALENVPAPEPEEGPFADAAEQREGLHHAVGTLNPRDRLLVRLRFEDDASVREIARLMGFPTVFHVYRQLDRVLAVLRDQLTAGRAEGGGPPPRKKEPRVRDTLTKGNVNL